MNAARSRGYCGSIGTYAPTGLKNAEQAHDQIQRSIQIYTDKHIRSHAELTQEMRESIGALVELAVGEAGITEDDRDAVGSL